MKFICTKQNISEAVINVSKAVSERTTMPSLEGIKFDLKDSLLTLTGYDLEIGIKTTISVRSNEEGSFILNAKLFSDIIRKMPDEDILIEINENNQAKISGNVTNFNMFASSSEDYPELPEKEDNVKIEISQPLFKEMINQTKFAAAITDIKPILKGELFEIEKDIFNLVAIDGYRLAVRYESIKYDKDVKFVVPSKTMGEIATLLSDDQEEIIKMYPSRKHIIFEIGGYMVYSRLLEGEFHPYKTAIPNKYSTEVTVDRKELMESLERAMLLISERTPAPIRCYFGDNKIKISCATSLGKFTDEIKADISGPVIEIGFKCKFLLDPLKVINEDKIKIQMSGSLLPMKIISCTNKGYIYLVLPVRMPKE